MKNSNKILGIMAACAFAGLFLLNGYSFVISISSYQWGGYLHTDNFMWISIFLTAAVIVCFFLVALGCFIRKKGLQKTGLVLLTVVDICSIFFSYYYLRYVANNFMTYNKTPAFFSYCMYFAELAYALLLLMAMRIPAKSRLLGIIAAAVYTTAFAWYNIALEASFSVLGVIYILLIISGAVLFGYLIRNMETELQQIPAWVCPECGTENQISRMNCAGCGKQRA